MKCIFAIEITNRRAASVTRASIIFLTILASMGREFSWYTNKLKVICELNWLYFWNDSNGITASWGNSILYS